MIELARRRGVDVGIDVYPWTYRGGIVRGFPTWAQEGGPERMRERLNDPETRSRIREYVKEQMESVEAEHTWDRALILTASEEDQDLVGKFMTEAAEMRGVEPVDLYLDRMAEDKALCIDARITVGAIRAASIRMNNAEEALRGRPLSKERIEEAADLVASEAHPFPHHGYTVPYLRECLKVETRRTIESALGV